MPEIIEKPKVEIAPEILEQLNTMPQEEGQVVVHCIYTPVFSFDVGYARIWPSTWLEDRHTDHRSKLVHVEGITLTPEWTRVEPFHSHFFTLIFTPLPADCVFFDLIEDCMGQQGAFIVKNIRRNREDVYYVRV